MIDQQPIKTLPRKLGAKNTFFFSLLCALRLTISSAHATSVVPHFDFYESLDRADAAWILSFEVKNGLALKGVLSGPKSTESQWKLVRDNMKNRRPEIRQHLDNDGPLELVVFPRSLNDGKGYFNLKECAVIEGDTVQINQMIRPEYTRSSFLAEFDRVCSLKKELSTLLSSSPTTEQLEKIIEFLMNHDEPSKFASHGNHYFNRKFSRYLGASSQEASELILRKLLSSKSESEQRRLIDLVGSIALTSHTSEVVATFLERSHPPEVRRAAIRALEPSVTHQALGTFIPYLTVDEPELYTFLTVSNQNDRASPHVKNPAVLESLTELAFTIRERPWPENPEYQSQITTAILGYLRTYRHPRHISLLLDWSEDKGDPSSRLALMTLNEISAWPIMLDDETARRAWWALNKPLLSRKYDLEATADLEDHLESLAKADSTAKPLLLGLWDFEPVINESALVAKAVKNEFAREILAKLWKEKRLSPDSRKAIVKNHLTFCISPESTRIDQKLKGSISLELSAKTDFPFPPGAVVHYSSNISTESEPEPGPYRISFSLNKISLRSLPGGQLNVFPSEHAKAFAVVGLREIDEPWKKVPSYGRWK